MFPQVLEFSTNHPVLSLSFVSVLGFILFYEFRAVTQKFSSIGPAAAIALINNDDEKTVLLDVREMNEIADGMIGGAHHIPLSAMKTRVGEMDKYKNDAVLVYCRSGNRSGSVCRTLTGRGFEKVYNLTGGIMSWQDAHLPVSTAGGQNKGKSKKKKKNG